MSKENLFIKVCILMLITVLSIYISIYTTNFEFFFFIGFITLILTVVNIIKFISNYNSFNYSKTSSSDFIPLVYVTQQDVSNKV